MTRTPYTTVANVEDYLLKDITPAFEANITGWILAMSNEMDRMANRKLVADTYDSDEAFEIKYFDVEHGRYLSIEDCQAIDLVEQKKDRDTWELSTEYEQYPVLAPIRKLIGSFPYGLQSVRIGAKWGLFDNDAIPPDLEHAATVLVAGVCLANQAAGGSNSGPVVREKIGNYEVAFGSGNDSAGRAGGFKDYEAAMATVNGYRKIAV